MQELKILLQIMMDTARSPKVLDCCVVPSNRLADLQALTNGLERCQKMLNEYLESKRNAFPRFFFLSDDELLSILGSSQVTCCQEHMVKVSQVGAFCLSFLFTIVWQ